MVATERAVIGMERIDATPVNDGSQVAGRAPGMPPPQMTLSVWIHNSGRTAVRVVSYSINTHLGPLPATPPDNRPWGMDNIVEQGQSCSFDFGMPIGFDHETRDAIWRGETRFWVYGVIRYVDFLDEVFEAGFSAYWNFSDVQSGGAPRQDFLFAGSLQYGFLRKVKLQ